jgi:hypothetical protein
MGVRKATTQFLGLSDSFPRIVAQRGVPEIKMEELSYATIRRNPFQRGHCPGYRQTTGERQKLARRYEGQPKQEEVRHP